MAFAELNRLADTREPEDSGVTIVVARLWTSLQRKKPLLPGSGRSIAEPVRLANTREPEDSGVTIVVARLFAEEKACVIGLLPWSLRNLSASPILAS